MNTKIILIVGPSGVGKDTLLKEAQQSLCHNKEFNFVKRYVSRKPNKDEDNYYIPKKLFSFLNKYSLFSSIWEAHGNLYAIAKESILYQKVNVISVSRGVVEDFESRYNDVTTIQITLSYEELKKRLMSRGREDERAIQKRLERSFKTIKAKSLVTFNNTEEIKISSEKFQILLQKLANDERVEE